jgi:hypothetical protein
MTFELLSRHGRFGKWYLSHVEREQSLIERLRHYIAEDERRISEIETLISDVLHIPKTD